MEAGSSHHSWMRGHRLQRRSRCGFCLLFSPVRWSSSLRARRRRRATIAPLTAAEVRAIMSAPDAPRPRRGRAMADVLAEGMRRSGTFAHLVLALNKSDVIVYIESGRVLPSSDRRAAAARGRSGRHALPAHSGERAPGSNDMIALVGHELRHALEVAESPDVRDEASLIALYERIGHPARDTHHYDTRPRRTPDGRSRRNSRVSDSANADAEVERFNRDQDRHQPVKLPYTATPPAPRALRHDDDAVADVVAVAVGVVDARVVDQPHAVARSARSCRR